MKRHVWLSLGLGLSLLAAACDDDNKGNSLGDLGDGGMGADGDYSDEIRGLQDQINQLGGGQMTLGDRLTMLETPKTPGSCSAGELCIPDGINLSRMGMQPIISALCTREADCCTAGELNWIFGPAVTTAADCELAFTDLVNNGISQTEPTFAAYLDPVVRIAQAFNNTDIHIAVNAEGVAACAQAITGRACPGVGDEENDDACRPRTTNTPCALKALVTGLETEGEPCHPGSQVPECAEGFVCRSIEGSPGSQSGLCAPKAVAGDRCTSDADCDDLYCAFATGTCQARGKKGEPCAYVDPTFEHVSPAGSKAIIVLPGTEPPVGNGDNTSADCEVGLSCDPIAQHCTEAYCAIGSFCLSHAQCPTGTLCRMDQNEAMQQLTVGVCGTPVALDGVCHGSEWGANDCASRHCSAP